MSETSPTAPEKQELVLLGRITGVHGLKGEVKIAAYTGEPEDIASYGPLTSADGARHFHISVIRSVKGADCYRRAAGRQQSR